MRWVTSEDVPRSGELRVPMGAIFTPSARELAEARAIRIIELPAGQAAPAAPPEQTIALGADHGGFRLKEAIKPLLADLGLETRDVGVYDEKPADYPDIALKVAELVARGEARRGRNHRWRGDRLVDRGQQSSGNPRGAMLRPRVGPQQPRA